MEFNQTSKWREQPPQPRFQFNIRTLLWINFLVALFALVVRQFLPLLWLNSSVAVVSVFYILGLMLYTGFSGLAYYRFKKRRSHYFAWRRKELQESIRLAELRRSQRAAE